MTDSSTGGSLVQSGSGPLEDDALDDFFQALVCGVTGLSGIMVFPRYQQAPPNLPPAGTNWASIGVMPTASADDFPFVGHAEVGGAGQDQLTTHETLLVLASFYGPAAKANAGILRDGMKIAQNREPLFLAGMGLISVGPATRAPELVKSLWLNRYDITLTVRRAITRVFPVLDLAAFGGILARDNGQTLPLAETLP
jgi:hypothetical protein